jgi:hypothetical protein
MADQYTPEEIQGIFEAYNNAIKSGTPITQEMANAMKDAEKGLKGYSKAMADAQSKMGKGVVDFTKAMYKGEQGMSAMNGAIDSLAGGLEALLLIIPGSALLKAGLFAASKVVGVFAEGLKTVNKQSDAVFKAYQDLSKSGAAAAGGMTEITANMQKLGYGFEQLDQMTAIIKENSAALASFGGTAASGTRAFADAASQIQRSDVGKSLQMLGKTPDDINRGIAMFVKQQQMSGVTSTNIQQNLAARSAEYIKQLDLMSKLTGESAEALQENRNQAMAENAFNQTIYELRKKGDQASLDLADEYIKMSDMLKTSPALQKDYWRSIGGDVSASGKMMTMGMSEFALYTQDKNFKAAAGMDKLTAGMKQFDESGMASMYKFNGAMDDAVYDAETRSRILSRNTDVSMKQQEDLAKAQQELQQKGLDPNTKAQVELRINQMKSRDSLQSFVTMGVNPATTSLEALSKVTNKIAGVAPGNIASTQGIGGGPAKTFGGQGAGSSQNADTAMKFFQSAGWTKEQAAGIVGNLQQESGKNLNINAVGDGGKAKGVAQWHPDRQANFERVMGKTLKDSTLEEQLKFVDYELKNTEKRAGDQLRQAKTAAQAAQLVDRLYERSAGTETGARMANAELLAGQAKTTAQDARSELLAGQAKTTAQDARSELLAGPKNSFDNKLAAIKPNATLPEKEVAKANQEASRTDHSEEILGTLNSALQSMDRRLANIDDNSKKQAQNSAR